MSTVIAVRQFASHVRVTLDCGHVFMHRGTVMSVRTTPVGGETSCGRCLDGSPPEIDPASLFAVIKGAEPTPEWLPQDPLFVVVAEFDDYGPVRGEFDRWGQFHRVAWYREPEPIVHEQMVRSASYQQALERLKQITGRVGGRARIARLVFVDAPEAKP